jgi:hypothetical protein
LLDAAAVAIFGTSEAKNVDRRNADYTSAANYAVNPGMPNASGASLSIS